MTPYSIVIPTIGRSSLRELLASIDAAPGPAPERIVLVDDRRDAESPLEHGADRLTLRDRVVVVRSHGRGPAAARNAGWREAPTRWIAFLDDDVRVTPEWRADLQRDLERADEATAGISARIDVPLPQDRPATDWERNVASLATAAWITADMLYRRDVLVRVGGFDPRFPRAYREDADLALRVQDAGFALRRGERRSIHPVRAADPWISVRLQRGNADDVLMAALHGRNWRERAVCPKGRFAWHAATVVAAALAAAGLAGGRRAVAVAGAVAWSLLTAEFAWRRIAPGPRTTREVAAMTATSAAIPFAAVYHRARGAVRAYAVAGPAS